MILVQYFILLLIIKMNNYVANLTNYVSLIEILNNESFFLYEGIYDYYTLITYVNFKKLFDS